VYEDSSFDPKKRFLPRGAIYGAKGLSVVEPKVEQLREDVEHSWYDSKSGLNPTEGATHLDFTEYNTEKQYSYVKAPRLNGEPMEAGPLSRMLVAYLSGNEAVKGIIDGTLAKLGAAGKPEVLLSLLGRVAARNLEAKVVADQMVVWLNDLIGALKGGDSSFFVTERAGDGSGAGLWEAPRGALSHFMTVKGGKIAGYQVVTPSTWDMSPRDKDGKRGPLEEALIGAPITDVEKPMEALRIVHSFDP
jgi:Ni,Fe-hydrogenase I large subunit